MKAITRRRRGAPRKGEEGVARQRILATASALFYRKGIQAIGVDTVAEESGISKTSLYRLFDSKDALIAAFAAEQNQAFWAWWDKIEERFANDPHAMLDALLLELARQIGQPTFRGCPFLNLMTEFPESKHPGRVIARRNKDELRRRLVTIVAKLGADDPDRVGSQLALMVNGASVAGLFSKRPDLHSELVGAAMKLLAKP